MRRHLHTRPPHNRILRPPQTSHRLRLRIKINPTLPIKRTNPPTRHTLLISGKTKHRQWNRDGHIDTDLAGFDFFLEAPGRGARAGEESDAVAVFVGVDERDGGVEGGGREADEDGAEDFFAVAAHGGGDVGDYCWAKLGEWELLVSCVTFPGLRRLTQLPLGYFSGL